MTAIFAAIFICLLTVFFCYRYNKKTFDTIDGILERILSKRYDELNKSTSDNRISKLIHKANRVISMCVHEVTQTNAEKETIQGFISDMSHQMKTPLAAIAMYTELLAEGGLTEAEQQDFLTRMKVSTAKLQWMTESLIKMSRLETGIITPNPIESGIKQTISESVLAAGKAADDRSIVVVDFDDVVLYHDKKWTVEAIGNIFENAVKYSEEGSEIIVTIKPMQQYTSINITNKGAGIPRSDWHLVFKRFYRGANVRDKEGVGLGLYLVRLIMQKQSGYVMVDSVPNEYTTFSLFLQNCKK